MQLGPDFQLSRDTQSVIQYINSGKCESMKKDIQFVVKNSLESVLQYNRDRKIPDEDDNVVTSE
jgi:hypothetical protein